MSGSRAQGLLAAGLTALALALAVTSLDAAPDAQLVARWWPATVLVTIVFLFHHRADLRTLTLLTAAGFFAAGLLGGRDGLFSVGFAVANVIEVLVVVWSLTRFEDTRPELRAWGDYRRWLIGISLGTAACGLIVAATVWVSTDEAPWRTLLWIWFTHLGAQAVVLPLVMQQPRHRIRVSALEVALHCLLLGTAVAACVTAERSQPVAFLLLPVLMWAAARFSHLWANLELVAVGLGIAVLTTLGHGPFADVRGEVPLLGIAASAQVFVAIGAVTAVAFSVAMSHLRDSLARIRQNEVQLGQLLDSASGTAFIATDLEGTITWFSPGAEQLLGYSGEELVGRSTPLPFHEPHEIVARAHALGTTAGTYRVVTLPLERGVEQDTRDWTYVRHDGSRLTVSLSVTAVRDDDGRPVSYLSVVRDVTDRRAAEQALVFALDKEREANRRMHEVDRVKGDFVSTVSHELRTPLTSIIGYTELLSEGLTGPMTTMQEQLVEKIDRNGSRLLDLVEDLLTLSRVEDGSFALDAVPTDLRAPVRSATDEMASSAHQSRVTLRVTVPAEPVTVFGDVRHLERLVLNLVGNAIKFTEAGGSIDVTLAVRDGSALLSVADTGMGIAPEEQARLFERFFRSSLANEHAIQGTGLGLNIGRSIAEAHGGSIDFESTLGVGTTFRVVVPLCGPEADADEPAPAVDAEARGVVRREVDRRIEALFCGAEARPETQLQTQRETQREAQR